MSELGGFNSEKQNEGSRFRCYGLWPRLSQSAGPWAKVSVGQRARERGPAVIGGRVMLPARQGLAIFAGQRALESARGCSHAAGMADFALKRTFHMAKLVHLLKVIELIAVIVQGNLNM